MRFEISFPSESKKAVKNAQMTILITLQRKAGCQPLSHKAKYEMKNGI